LATFDLRAGGSSAKTRDGGRPPFTLSSASEIRPASQSNFLR
jgi:hypothetical protein